MWTSETHRDAEALCAPDGDVGSPASRARDFDQGEQVAGRHDESVGLGGALGQGSGVVELAVGRRQLKRYTESVLPEIVLLEQLGAFGDDDLDVEGPGSGFEHGPRLGMKVVADQKALPFAAVCLVAQRHRLGDSGRFVE